MELLIFVAVLGAALGGFLKPRPLAVVLACGLAGGLRGGLDMAARQADSGGESPAWAQWVEGLMASPLSSYLMLMAAAGAGALVSALLCLVLDRWSASRLGPASEGDIRTRDRTGRYRRAAGMIEERSIHAEAERRIQANMNG